MHQMSVAKPVVAEAFEKSGHASRGKIRRSEGMRDVDFACYPAGCVFRGGFRPDLHEAHWINSGARRARRATAAWRIQHGPFRAIQKRRLWSAQVAPAQQAPR